MRVAPYHQRENPLLSRNSPTGPGNVAVCGHRLETTLCRRLRAMLDEKVCRSMSDRENPDRVEGPLRQGRVAHELSRPIVISSPLSELEMAMLEMIDFGINHWFRRNSHIPGWASS